MGESPALPEELNRRVRRFATRLTIGFIIGGNVLFLAALWFSGLDLDQVFADQDLFDPTRDICLRMAWYRPQGEQEPVRLCKEWINLKDSSGTVHKFQKDLPITKGADGKFYVQPSHASDRRLIALLTFILVLIVVGMGTQRYLITRYRARLTATKLP
jgi:hypothetical protein